MRLTRWWQLLHLILTPFCIPDKNFRWAAFCRILYSYLSFDRGENSPRRADSSQYHALIDDLAMHILPASPFSPQQCFEIGQSALIPKRPTNLSAPSAQVQHALRHPSGSGALGSNMVQITVGHGFGGRVECCSFESSVSRSVP
jgi:hypothetical protein